MVWLPTKASYQLRHSHQPWLAPWKRLGRASGKIREGKRFKQSVRKGKAGVHKLRRIMKSRGMTRVGSRGANLKEKISGGWGGRRACNSISSSQDCLVSGNWIDLIVGKAGKDKQGERGSKREGKWRATGCCHLKQRKELRHCHI